MKKLSPLEKGIFGLWVFLLGYISVFAAMTWYQTQTDMQRKADLDRTAQLIELYYFNHFSYPQSLSGKLAVDGHVLNWGEAWSPYTSNLPSEVSLDRPGYCYLNQGSGFSLYAQVRGAMGGGKYFCNAQTYNYQVSHRY